MASAGQERVFAIPELLEAIFLQLPLRDLLLFQRVCRGWQRFITESPTLQRALFFQSVSDPNHEPEINPLLLELVPPFFAFAIQPIPAFSIPFDIHQRDWYKDESRRQKVLRPEASWRRMYPVQPRARIEGIHQTGGCGCGFGESHEGVIRESFQHLQADGATMGLLWDVTAQTLLNKPLGHSEIHWHMFRPPPYDFEDVYDEEIDDYVPGEMAEGVFMGNVITIENTHSGDCYTDRSAIHWLTEVEIDPQLIEYDDEIKEVSVLPDLVDLSPQPSTDEGSNFLMKVGRSLRDLVT